MTGTIFDIQKFALHDGPGIRTVVFLKGCPLTCQWCSNPESQALHPQLAFLQQNCVNCGECIKACPNSAHHIQNDKHWVDFSKCLQNGECVKECAFDALRMIGYRTTVKDVLDIVEQDRLFYDKSGGGITLSGGEPTLQFNFTYELLSTAKNRNINTCIETCGYTTTDNFAKLINKVDHFLFDVKLFNDAEHQKYTGVSNVGILKNLQYLYDNNAQMTMRCPIIPGINDTKAHFQQIAKFEKSHPKLHGIEIMPYHNLGISKAKYSGLASPVNQESVDAQTVDSWLKTLTELGCKKIKRG